ncbi:hypothetical protein TNCT_613431 [Trichonephila clavata]|uniref:Uncharacterized protein n=1 Tax=Trichonephila clavata TaxID=2740835 RepID=A0A8X6I305_TRICU|nr:hypothetical protein TNCT_613431 [Trichonephila clavata]
MESFCYIPFSKGQCLIICSRQSSKLLKGDQLALLIYPSDSLKAPLIEHLYSLSDMRRNCKAYTTSFYSKSALEMHGRRMDYYTPTRHSKHSSLKERHISVVITSHGGNT